MPNFMPSQKHSYDKAQKYYENYLQEVDQHCDYEEKIYILNNLGANNLNQGNFPEAIQNFKEAIQVLESSQLNNKNKWLSALNNNLGYSYSCIQQYENAIRHHTTALEIEKTISQGSEGMASILNNIGIAYSNLRQFQKSIQVYNEALEIQIKYSGEKNPNAAKTYDNIGTAYLRSGQPIRAIEYHSKGLEIFKTIFGEKHPDTAQAYTLIGGDYEKLGDINRALEFKLKALEVTKALFGYAHPDTKEAYKNLGGFCLQTGQFGKAIEFYSKSLEIEKLTGEEDHNNLKDLYFGLGCSYAMMKQNKISNEHFLKGLEIHEAHFQEDTPETITARQNVARNYLQLNEYAKCIEAYKKILPIREQETDYRTLSIIYFNMGTCYRELGSEKEAIQYHIKDLKLMESKLYNFSEIVDCCFIIAELYLELKELDKSLEFFSKLIDMVTLNFGDKSSWAAENYKKIGILCHNKGHPQKAAEFLSKFIEIQKPVLGENHKDIVLFTGLVQKYRVQNGGP